jgi:DNA-binding transcriptional LysR family regulator
MVELRHLRYFRVVAEELHFGRAAARLHMEPQPLNFQIKQLERELGFALLVRRENRTLLTPAGAAFLADAEGILSSADRAVERAAAVARGEAGLLRIGYVTPMTHAFLAPAIKGFHEAYPAVTFDLHALRAVEQERALNRHELELGFAVLPVPDDNFDALPIRSMKLTIAASPGSALAGRERIEWGELHDREVISLERAFPEYQHRIDAMLARHGVAVRVVQHADDLESALALVNVGLGIAVVPSVNHALSRDLSFVALPDDADEIEIAAIWRRDDDSPLRDHFVALLAEQTQGEPVG